MGATEAIVVVVIVVALLVAVIVALNKGWFTFARSADGGIQIGAAKHEAVRGDATVKDSTGDNVTNRSEHGNAVVEGVEASGDIDNSAGGGGGTPKV